MSYLTNVVLKIYHTLWNASHHLRKLNIRQILEKELIDIVKHLMQLQHWKIKDLIKNKNIKKTISMKSHDSLF